MSATKKRFQVFISSTYSDLHAERQELTLALLDQYIPSGMEAFPASPERGWATIQAAIDDSDYYVLILAGRYGSIDKQTGLSWTEREYRYALDKHIPVLAFPRSDDHVDEAQRDTEPTKVEKLGALREEVRDRVLCKEWTNSDSLVRHVKDALSAAIRSQDVGNRPGWYRGEPPDPLQIPSTVQPRPWSLRDALRVELLPDDANAVLLRSNETSVKLWLRLTNLAPFQVTPEKVALKWHVTLDTIREGLKDVIEPFEPLGPAKHQVLGVDLVLPAVKGRAPTLARLATVGSVVATAEELGGRTKTEIGSFVYGRVGDERGPDLATGMSESAYGYMVKLAEAYRAAGYSNYKVWQFDAGREEPHHVELMNLHRFIKLMGTRGAPYVLTGAGFDWVKAFLVRGGE